MKLDTVQLLRAGLERPELVPQIPEEILSGWEQRFITEMRLQTQLGIKPTLQSVTKSIYDAVDAKQKPEIQALSLQIKGAGKLDSSSQQLMLFKARREATRRLMQLLLTITEEGTKEEAQILNRIEALKADIVEQFAKPVNAKQYDQLVKLDEREAWIDVDWFKDNGVSIKSKVLYAIITMTNGGKTIIKTWLAFELMKAGQNVLFLAQEEPKEDAIRRIHQQALGLTEKEYKQLTEKGFEFIGQKFNALCEEKKWGNIWVAEWSGIQVDLLKQYVEALEKTEGQTIDGIIIDYAKLINVTTKTTQEWERVGKVFQELKTLAMQTDKWILTSIQLNREASERMVTRGQTPDLFDVAGAYEATHHVNYAIVAQLRYSEMNEPNPDANTIRGTFDLTVQKEKYGDLHKGATMRFNWTADNTLTQTTIPSMDITIPSL